jgi:hypothetical protein
MRYFLLLAATAGAHAQVSCDLTQLENAVELCAEYLGRRPARVLTRAQYREYLLLAQVHRSSRSRTPPPPRAADTRAGPTGSRCEEEAEQTPAEELEEEALLHFGFFLLTMLLVPAQAGRTRAQLALEAPALTQQPVVRSSAAGPVRR